MSDLFKHRLAEAAERRKKLYAKWTNLAAHPVELVFPVENERKPTKKQLVEIKGGACVGCGLRASCLAVYDFDHRDPTQKLFGLSYSASSGYTRAEVLAELEKCDLVCANCHRTRHANCSQ